MLMLVTKNCGISSSRIVKCYKYMILILSNQVWLLDSSITDTWVLITNTYIYEEVRVSNTRDWNNGVQYLRNNSWEHWRKSKVCLLGSISPTNGDDSQSSTPYPLFMLKSLYGAAIRYTTRRERVYCHGQSLTYNLETIIMGY